MEVVTPDTLAERALLAAVRKNDPEAVRRAFEQGADPNGTLLYRWPKEQQGPTPPKPEPLLALIGPRHEDAASTAQAVSVFRQFLERGVDLRATDAYDRNPVILALILGDTELVRAVLDKGADINAAFRMGMSGGNAVNLLVAETIRGQEANTLPLLTLLLERGADPNAYDPQGMTPLHRTAIVSLPRTAELLLKHGADSGSEIKLPHSGRPASFVVTGTPVIVARRFGNEEMIHIFTVAKKSLTPTEAATIGNASSLRQHLDGGVSPNQRDEAGLPFVALAAGSGSIDSVRLLLDRGADPNAADPEGITALHRAAQLGHADIVRLLLDRRANPNAHGGDPELPETPLTYAVTQANTEVVTLLLAHGADISLPGNRDALARLVRNCIRGPQRVVGQDPRTLKRGKDALDAKNRIYDILVARTNVRRDGGAPLCAAAEIGQWKVARDMVARGAPINAHERFEGKTALMLTVDRIGFNRNQASPEMAKMEGLTAAEVKKRKQDVAENDATAMAFLQYLLARKPDVNAVRTGRVMADEPSTALGLARFWGMNDVTALLKRAGARR